MKKFVNDPRQFVPEFLEGVMLGQVLYDGKLDFGKAQKRVDAQPPA